MHTHKRGYTGDAGTPKIAARRLNLDSLPGLTGFDGAPARQVTWVLPWLRAEAVLAYWSTQAPDVPAGTDPSLAPQNRRCLAQEQLFTANSRDSIKETARTDEGADRQCDGGQGRGGG